MVESQLNKGPTLIECIQKDKAYDAQERAQAIQNAFSCITSGPNEDAILCVEALLSSEMPQLQMMGSYLKSIMDDKQPVDVSVHEFMNGWNTSK